MNTKKLNRTVTKKTTKIEQKVNRMVKRVAFVSVIVGAVGAIHLSNASLAWLQSKEIRPMYVISLKNQSITFQTPLRDRTEEDKKFHSPIPQVQAIETKQVAVPTQSPDNTIERAYDTVWFHETNRGKDLRGLNGDCIALGMINEIGYAPGLGYCFKDRAEQKATFTLWVKNRLGLDCVKKGYCRATIEELLSLYSNSAYNSLLESK